MTISQISFDKKQPVEQHVLMCGDTAGVIHPLCGNGMAMAIESARLASELIMGYFQDTVSNRSQLENQYTLAWNAEFRKRLATGRFIQSLLQKPPVASVLIKSLQLFPAVLPLIIKRTHGSSVG